MSTPAKPARGRASGLRAAARHSRALARQLDRISTPSVGWSALDAERKRVQAIACRDIARWCEAQARKRKGKR